MLLAMFLGITRAYRGIVSMDIANWYLHTVWFIRNTFGLYRVTTDNSACDKPPVDLKT